MVIIYLNSINTFISVIYSLCVCEEDTEILRYLDFTLWRVKLFYYFYSSIESYSLTLKTLN